MSEIVGKKELCEALKWGRPRLDRRLQSDEHFPIVSRGDQSGGWKFRLQDVLDYLNGVTRPAAGKGGKQKPKPPAAPSEKPKPLSPAPKPVRATAAPVSYEPPETKRRSAYHAGEANAKQRKDDADATLREMKIAALAGDLVQKAQVEQVFTMIFASLANDLDALPEEIVKTCNLPIEATDVIRTKVDAARSNIVRHGEQLLKQQ